MQHRNDIDGLRCVAVLPVLCFHFTIYWPLLGMQIAPGGFVGVDIFFVISGYLITGILYDQVNTGTYSVAEFYNRRLRRIFPALVTIFIACLGAYFFFGFPSDVASAGNAVVASALFVSNIYFYHLTDYFNVVHRNPLVHTWSLSVEEQFYVLFPILIYVLKRFSRSTQIKALVACALASLLYSVVQVNVNVEPPAAFYLLQSRTWELLLGSLLAVAPIPKTTGWRAELLGGAGLVLILASVQLYSSLTPFPGLAALAPCIGAAAIIYSGTATTTLTGRLLASPPLRFIGLISYSLYLWHWPVITFYLLLYPSPSNRIRLALAAICIVLATISWKFIENPFRQKPYRLGIRGTIAGGVAAMIAASLVGITIGAASNTFWKPPNRVQEILAYLDYDWRTEMRAGTCFLTPPTHDFSTHFSKRDCLTLKPGKNFLILGDSHAADLWYGLQTTYPDVNFLQATVASCRPVLKSNGSSSCKELMQFIFKEFLPNTHLDGIILAARWEPELAKEAKTTAQFLRAYADRVFVFGPTVEYDQDFPRIWARSLVTNDADLISRHRVNAREEADRVLASEISADKDITYVSIYRAFCNPKCALSAEGGQPLQWDYGHLTREGSIYVASRIRSSLFDK